MVNSVRVNGINHLRRRRAGSRKGEEEDRKRRRRFLPLLLDQMRWQWLLRLPPFILLWSNTPHFPEYHSAPPLKQPAIFKMIHLSRCSWPSGPPVPWENCPLPLHTLCLMDPDFHHAHLLTYFCWDLYLWICHVIHLHFMLSVHCLSLL